MNVEKKEKGCLDNMVTDHSYYIHCQLLITK